MICIENVGLRRRCVKPYKLRQGQKFTSIFTEVIVLFELLR